MRHLYKWRGVLAAPPIVFATLCPRAASFGLATGFAVGVPLVLLGWAIRIWARRHSRELHTPLIVAPALLKPGILQALALLSSSR